MTHNTPRRRRGGEPLVEAVLITLMAVFAIYFLVCFFYPSSPLN